MVTPWPTVETVAVELVPAEHQHGPLADAVWVVVQRFPDRTMRVHLPTTDEERAAHPVTFGRAVAAQVGAVFVEPPRWLWFTRLDDTTWTAWDHRRCAPHNKVNCRAGSCRTDDHDITEPPVPTLTIPTRTEVPTHA